jgi:hypothetical protein
LLALDRQPDFVLGRPSIDRAGLAFDRESVRTKSPNGHLNVAVSNISKAGVNKYLGREIPGCDELGLDPDRIYRLLRDPAELEKAAPTFNDLPLLSRHVAVTADSHPNELVIGTTGSAASYEHPYLRNGLAIWAKGGIDAVESDAQKELSSAYRYRADMTPGVYQGEAYDGVMRDIVGNHVALVKEGRAGPDVVVGDSNEEIRAMAKKVLLSRTALMTVGAMLAGTAPLLAMDQKMPDFLPAVSGVKSLKDFTAKKADVIGAYRAAMKDAKLAQDADIEDVVKIIECLDKPGGMAATDADPDDSPAVGLAPDDPIEDPLAAIKAYLREKGVADDVIDALPALGAAAAATDADPPFLKKKDGDDDKDKKIDKPAMDAAIRAAVDAEGKRQQGIRDAERHVRPFVGELSMAFDSGEAVYRHVLKGLGVKGHDIIHASALPTILDMQPKPGARPRVENKLAQDAALQSGFSKDFPGADRLRAV